MIIGFLLKIDSEVPGETLEQYRFRISKKTIPQLKEICRMYDLSISKIFHIILNTVQLGVRVH
jgi:hypothetical protein